MMSLNSIDLSTISTPRLAREASVLVRSIEDSNGQVFKWLCIMCVLVPTCLVVTLTIGSWHAFDVPTALISAAIIVYSAWRWRRAVHTCGHFIKELRALDRELAKRKGRHGHLVADRGGSADGAVNQAGRRGSRSLHLAFQSVERATFHPGHTQS